MKSKVRPLVLFLGCFILALGLASYFFTKPNTATSKSSVIQTVSSGEGDVIYYYGEGCPHCKNVDDYITQNGVDKKIKIEKKEAWSDTTNAAEMLEKAKICNLSEADSGVPFVFDKTTSKCIIGDTPVIDFLKQKAGL